MDDDKFQSRDSYQQVLRKEVFGPEIPRVPQSLLDGSMTLKEFAEWAQATDDVQMQDDVVIRDWITPYIRKSLERLRRKINAK